MHNRYVHNICYYNHTAVIVTILLVLLFYQVDCYLQDLVFYTQCTLVF